MIYLVVFAVHVLAVASATRLVTTDKITEAVRRKIDTRFGQESYLAYLVWCDWCVATWIAAATSIPIAVSLITYTKLPIWLAVVAWTQLTLATRYAGAYLLTHKDN